MFKNALIFYKTKAVTTCSHRLSFNYNDFVLFCTVNETELKLSNIQYPAILTSRLVNNAYIVIHKTCLIAREIPIMAVLKSLFITWEITILQICNPTKAHLPYVRMVDKITRIFLSARCFQVWKRSNFSFLILFFLRDCVEMFRSNRFLGLKENF